MLQARGQPRAECTLNTCSALSWNNGQATAKAKYTTKESALGLCTSETARSAGNRNGGSRTPIPPHPPPRGSRVSEGNGSQPLAPDFWVRGHVTFLHGSCIRDPAYQVFYITMHNSREVATKNSVMVAGHHNTMNCIKGSQR